MSFSVFGKDRVVYAVAFHGDNFDATVEKIESHFDEVLPGSNKDDIPKSFEKYMEFGCFHPQLEPVYLWGSKFQRQVWKEITNIPFGEIVLYADIALNIGNDLAYRAVGRAVGANPIPILVPCHRVVAFSNIGGYTGGVELKRELLKIEGVLPG